MRTGPSLCSLAAIYASESGIATQFLFASRLSRFLATRAELLVLESSLDRKHRLLSQDLPIMTEKVGKWLDGAACESNLIA
jgi:hypothetical protein